MNDPAVRSRSEFLAAVMRGVLAGLLGASAVVLWKRGSLNPDCPAACPVCPHFAQCPDPARRDRVRP